LVLARLAAGERVVVVAASVGVSERTVDRVRVAAVLARRRVLHSPYRLSFVEREGIGRGIAVGESGRGIAGGLGRSASTVCREIWAGGGRRRYRAIVFERRAQRCARRPKATRLLSCPRLVAEVEWGLEQGWSPQQISAGLNVEFAEDPAVRISHETIYLSLYVQSRGELRRQLSA
jgi:transposase, IS30 family